MIAKPVRLALIVATTLIAASAALAASAETAPPAAPASGASAPVAPEATADQAGLCSPALDATADLFDRAAGQGDQHRGCPAGIRSCPASQVGQACNPNTPSILCSAQANGAYCCLAYAGGADTSLTERPELAAAGGGGGPCCTHDDKTACTASCQAAGCTNALAACINLRCSCRCAGCP